MCVLRRKNFMWFSILFTAVSVTKFNYFNSIWEKSSLWLSTKHNHSELVRLVLVCLSHSLIGKLQQYHSRWNQRERNATGDINPLARSDVSCNRYLTPDNKMGSEIPKKKINELVKTKLYLLCFVTSPWT